MKNIIKYGMWIMLSIFMFAACSPQEDEKYSLGELGTVTADVISFSQTPSDTSNNVIIFTNTSNLTFPVTAVWDLGNGSTARGNTATGIYPMKGDYTVTLTLYAADGSSALKSEVIPTSKAITKRSDFCRFLKQESKATRNANTNKTENE